MLATAGLGPVVEELGAVESGGAGLERAAEVEMTTAGKGSSSAVGSVSGRFDAAGVERRQPGVGGDGWDSPAYPRTEDFYDMYVGSPRSALGRGRAAQATYPPITAASSPAPGFGSRTVYRSTGADGYPQFPPCGHPEEHCLVELEIQSSR